MKTKILLLISIMRIYESMAQSPAELENKYWNYRDRMRKYFVQVGSGAGQSIPAASIYTHNNQSDTFRIVNGQEVSIPNNQRKYYGGRIRYGDATVDHGYYMAVLATEYWLLKQKGQTNTDEFKALLNELYFAIMVVDRLDYNAETYLKNGEPGTKNGFFIRSDNPSDFLKYFRQSRNPHQPIDNLGSGGTGGPEILFVYTANNDFKLYDPDSFRIDLATKD